MPYEQSVFVAVCWLQAGTIPSAWVSRLIAIYLPKPDADSQKTQAVLRAAVVKKQWYLLRHPQIEGNRYLQNVGTNFPSHTASCPGKRTPQTSNTTNYNTTNYNTTKLCLTKLIFLSHEALPTSFQQLRLPGPLYLWTWRQQEPSKRPESLTQPDSLKLYTPQMHSIKYNS
jgi:hypothetical protein